jgi:hypothetical protein
MGDDNYNDDLHGGLDPGIEARVAALVLGEVSGSEAEELECLMAEQPQLREFKQRVETLHGLLGETVGPQDDEEWKLSPERRAQLQEALVLPAPSEEIPVVGPDAAELARERRIRSAGRRVMWSVAACFALTLFLVTFLTQPWMAFDAGAGSGAEGSDQLAGPDRRDSLAPAVAQLDFESESPELSALVAEEGKVKANEPTKGRRLRSFPRPGKAEDLNVEEKLLSEDKDAGAGAPVEADGLARKAIGDSAVAEPAPEPPAPSTVALSLGSTVVESPRNGVPEKKEDSAQAITEEKEEGATREVAFLGLGVLLGLVPGLAFGLGLGRTWQRRTQSSH